MWGRKRERWRANERVAQRRYSENVRERVRKERKANAENLYL